MKKILFILAAALAVTSLAAVPKGWTDDFEAAQKRAEKEKLPLLVLFTGSDWCPWCVRLEQEIVSKPAFADVVVKEFVPVFLDFPNDESLVKPELRKKNEQLAMKYRVRGFPSVLLMDAAGKVKARTGYRAGGPEEYVKHLRGLLKKDEAK